jgi:membrane protein involved in colicin uptake
MKYKVITLALLLANNTVAKYGDEVNEDQLSSPADDLVKGKYIEEVAESPNDKLATEEAAKKLAEEQAVKEAEDKAAAEKEAAYNLATEEAAKNTEPATEPSEPVAPATTLPDPTAILKGKGAK